jgi:hypothetical protein
MKKEKKKRALINLPLVPVGMNDSFVTKAEKPHHPCLWIGVGFGNPECHSYMDIG